MYRCIIRFHDAQLPGHVRYAEFDLDPAALAQPFHLGDEFSLEAETFTVERTTHRASLKDATETGPAMWVHMVSHLDLAYDKDRLLGHLLQFRGVSNLTITEPEPCG